MFDFRIDDNEVLALRGRFERVYVRQNPKPAAQTSGLIRGALIILVIASVIVSASHTIPAFLSTIEGETHAVIKLAVALSAFIMVEVGMLVFAYVSTRRKDAAADGHINKQLRRGLLLAFVLAVVANLHSVLEPRFGGSQVWGIASFAVFVLVGVSAPTLAYIAGEVFGLTALADERRNHDANVAWQAAFDDAWERALEQYRRNALRVSKPLPSIPMEIPLETGSMARAAIPAQSTLGHNKIPDAAEKVRRHLEENPADLEMSGMKLAQLLGVGKSTAYAVLAEMKGKVQS